MFGYSMDEHTNNWFVLILGIDNLPVRTALHTKRIVVLSIPNIVKHGLHVCCEEWWRCDTIPRHAGPGCTVTNDTGWRQEAENMETLAAGAEPSPAQGKQR